MKRKGFSTVISVLGTVVTAAILIIFIVYIIPNIVKDIYGLIAQSSSEVVSRNLAGLITVSAAAPNEITIDYQASEDSKYHVNINERIVDVTLLTEVFGMKGESIIKSGIDSKCNSATETNCDFDQVNYFNIRKWNEDSGYVCDVSSTSSPIPPPSSLPPPPPSPPTAAMVLSGFDSHLYASGT